MKNGVLPLHKACHNKIAVTPFLDFVASYRGPLQEEGGLSKVCTSDGFDQNAFKLMKRSGYDFGKPPVLGIVVEARPYGLNDTQKMIRKQGGGVITPRIGLGYVPFQPVKISGWCKELQSLVQYITMEEADAEDGDQATSSSRVLVLDKLQLLMLQGCPTMFNRMGNHRAPKLFVFQRLKRDSQPKPSIFTRIAKGKKPSGSSPAQAESSMFNRLGDASERSRASSVLP